MPGKRILKDHPAYQTTYSLPRTNSLPQDDHLKFLGTSTTQHFFPKKPVDEARGENLQLIHFMGSKRSQYMGVMKREAPLFHKSMTNVQQDFADRGDPIDHDQFLATRELAKLNQPSVGGTEWAELKQDKGTTYKKHYTRATDTDFFKAKQKLKGPDYKIMPSERTLGGVGVMLDTSSHVQDTHAAPYADIKPVAEVRRPFTELVKHDEHLLDSAFQTAYHTHFGGSFQRGPPRHTSTLDRLRSQYAEMQAKQQQESVEGEATGRAGSSKGSRSRRNSVPSPEQGRRSRCPSGQ